MEVISSRDNSLIKLISKLKIKKHRLKENKFVVEGLRFVEEALNSSFDVSSIIISNSFKEKWEQNALNGKVCDGTKIYLVNDTVFNNISNTKNPQGIMAIVENRTVDEGIKYGFYILADKIQDPGNLGTIIRTAHASGASGVIVTKGTVDIYNEKTLRSTMGSIFNIPVFEDLDLSLVNDLKSKGFKVVTSSLGADKDFYELNLTDNIIIAVGNEGNGISKEVYELSDMICKIPMPGNAESLNASVAAAVMMYEVVRQKIYN
ncbi:putative TrmH family tRNA/rRNA methyltransferase [Clostridium tepidiprofundi DSM 19306]|uniref:Putative TrmH family tRNA/rRNA methyltransferase n=1 Tax=Clostridium tepidiprofundi DSM 19306 TaxID=1121338 RepID=A0A151B6D6_9CLOT|nr:RNA methyltransferase [Clostridium tepidiprofundi]KYH35495.1 putative TrmH family tRNA/rRNA methyltransferase [Clostridium tepidiprofundi DSM 19306]